MSESRFQGIADDGRAGGVLSAPRDREGVGTRFDRWTILPFDLRQLPRAVFGYDREATDELFESIAAFVEELELDQAALQEDLEQLTAEAAKGHDIERALGDALLAAKREAHAIREEARQDAKRTLKAARRKAKKTAGSAERVAQAKAREIVNDAARERDLIRTDVDRARAFVDETHEDLLSLLQSALKWFDRGTRAGKGSPPPAD